jgi:hypothetical protein
LSLSSQNIAAVFWHVSVWHHRTLHVFQNFRAHFSLSVGTLQLFSGAFESIITEYCSCFLARFSLPSQNITRIPELSGTFQSIITERYGCCNVFGGQSLSSRLLSSLRYNLGARHDGTPKAKLCPN